MQASQPFSQKSKAYIAALDVDKDEMALKAHGLHLRPECNQIRKVGLRSLTCHVSLEILPRLAVQLHCIELAQTLEMLYLARAESSAGKSMPHA